MPGYEAEAPATGGGICPPAHHPILVVRNSPLLQWRGISPALCSTDGEPKSLSIYCKLEGYAARLMRRLTLLRHHDRRSRVAGRPPGWRLTQRQACRPELGRLNRRRGRRHAGHRVPHQRCPRRLLGLWRSLRHPHHLDTAQSSRSAHGTHTWLTFQMRLEDRPECLHHLDHCTAAFKTSAPQY